MLALNEIIKNRQWKHNLELVKSAELGHDVSIIYALDNFHQPRYTEEDADLLNKLVFDNLISNSVSAIIGAEKNKGMVQIKSFEKNNYDVVEVTDTGKGIKQEYMKNLFKKGFSTKGTSGYGLYIARKLIHERFNGFIDVESDKDKTSFIVMLPIK